MKELYYVIQTLIHGRGANLIKVISLTLGLTVSILIRLSKPHRNTPPVFSVAYVSTNTIPS